MFCLPPPKTYLREAKVIIQRIESRASKHEVQLNMSCLDLQSTYFEVLSAAHQLTGNQAGVRNCRRQLEEVVAKKSTKMCWALLMQSYIPIAGFRALKTPSGDVVVLV